MLVLALSLTAFHVKSKTRSSSSLPLSLFVKNSFFISHAFVVWVQRKVIISQTKNQESERPHDPKRQKDLARLYV